jgi:hypothetical protein
MNKKKIIDESEEIIDDEKEIYMDEDYNEYEKNQIDQDESVE